MKNKKPIILIITFLILLVGIMLFYFFNQKDNLNKKIPDKISSETIFDDSLRINYIDGSDILVDSKNKIVTKKIEIKNASKEVKEYRLVFDNVINTLSDVNNLNYSYICSSTGSACDSKNNIIAPAKTEFLTNQIKIEGNTIHTYEINFSLIGNIIGDIFTAEINNNALNYLTKTDGQEDTRAFWLYRDNIISVTFNDKIKKPLSTIHEWDVSANKNKSIMAYLTYDGISLTQSLGEYSLGGDPAYRLYIQSTGEIFANPDSSKLFLNFRQLKEISNLYLFNTDNVTNMSSMFECCFSLEKINVLSFNTSKTTNMNNMFYFCRSLTSLDLSTFNTSNVTDMGGMFYFGDIYDDNPGSIAILNIGELDTSKVKDMSYMFGLGGDVVSLNLSSFDTTNVTDMSGMFFACSGLKKIDLTNFNTRNVTKMNGMFFGCSELTNLKLSNFNTDNVTDMSGMFANCEKMVTLDVSSFNTSNVENMSGMFEDCSSLHNLSLTNFNTSKVTDMSFMFASLYGSDSWKNLDLSSFDTSKVIEKEAMFAGAVSGINIIVKDKENQNFIKARLIDQGATGSVTIAV